MAKSVIIKFVAIATLATVAAIVEIINVFYYCLNRLSARFHHYLIPAPR